MTTKRINTAAWSTAKKQWRIDVQKEGERKSFYSSTPGRTGQREANGKADLWLECGVTSSRSKIMDLFEQFQAEREEVGSKTEYYHINNAGKNYIIPSMGKKKIAAISDSDIQNMLDRAAAKGLSKKTIQDINGIMNKFLKWCRRKGLTAYRPDDVVIPANARYKGKKVLQPADIVTLLNADTTLYKGQIIFEPLIYAYRFALFTGLRPGELRGLKRSDIDGYRVNVQRSINVYGEETKGKNENAVRSFIMSEQAHKAFISQITQCPKAEYIFDLPSPTCYRERFNAYCKANGMTVISPYEMRHTFVSVVKSLAPGEIKPIIGHSQDMDTFGIYSHFLQGEDTKTAAKITNLFEKISQPKAE